MINKENYINNIPQELKERNQWLWFMIYHNEDKNGKMKRLKFQSVQLLVNQKSGIKKKTGQVLKPP
ncbi:hypothetical protein KP743_10985 [Streptococcus equi subsp. zooepidemicus]|nr:hypothetical protein [Streptococcus equi subsp. zooepidemicus]